MLSTGKHCAALLLVLTTWACDDSNGGRPNTGTDAGTTDSRGGMDASGPDTTGSDLVGADLWVAVVDARSVDTATDAASADSAVTPDASSQSDSALVIYNGESVPFATSSGWDSNGSSLADSTADPFSGGHHLRCTLNVVNWWGAVAYLPYHNTSADWSSANELSFVAKADQPMTLQLELLGDNSQQSSSPTPFDLTTDYQTFTAPLSSLSPGLQLSAVVGLILSASHASNQSHTVDIDDIEINRVAQSPGIDADDPLIHYFGRWDFSDPKAPRSNWNATAIHFTFSGTSCAIRLNDGGNNWSYSIDGAAQQTLITGAQLQHSLASGLAAGTHTVEMTRRTESYFGVVTFRGIVLDPGETLATPQPKPDRKIEFIGDSITAGYGNEGSTQDRATQNAHMAYGPQTARALGAQWQVEAISGIGMYRTLGDVDPPTETTMPQQFVRTLADQPQPQWDFSSWQPHAVVVALGTNDYIDSYGGPPNRQQFRDTYANFLSTLRTAYPQAALFCLSPFAQSQSQQDIETVVDNAGDPNIYHIATVAGVAGADNVTTTPWLDGANGSDYIGDWTHPTVAGHTKIANQLSQEIADKLGW